MTSVFQAGTESVCVDALIRSAAAGDRELFGAQWGELLTNPAAVAVTTRAALDRLSGALLAAQSGAPDVLAISALVGLAQAGVRRIVGVNRVLLEHTARACLGLSDYLADVDPVYVCLYATAIVGALAAPAAESPPSQPEPVARASGRDADGFVLAAIEAVAGGDTPSWQRNVDAAVAADPNGADHASRRELRARLDRQEWLESDTRLLYLVTGAAQLCIAAADGPFAVPEYLIELVLRRALGEPGCMSYVDLREMTLAATEVAAMLDAYDAALSPSWGFGVYAEI